MAESSPQPDEISAQEAGQRLKYLDFVQVAAVQTLVWLSSFYDFAKENAGPLKPGVQTVEATVRGVLGPVYDRFHDVPSELLKFVDRKVDDSVREVERHVPSLVKGASAQAYTAVQKAQEVAREVAGEVQRSGVVATAAGVAQMAYTKSEPVAKELYTRYEPVAEHYAVATWRSLNRLPLVPQVAQILVPTAAYWSDKYNRTLRYAVERGCTAAEYLPAIPVERIAKVFASDDHESTGKGMAPPEAAEVPAE